MTYKFFKLNNGSSIVSNVTEETKDTYTLVMPAEIVSDIIEGQPRFKVDLFAGHVKNQTVVINKSSIMFSAEPNSPLVDYYEKNILGMVPQPTTQQSPPTFQITEEQAKNLEEEQA